MNKILLAGPAGSGKTHLLLDDFEQSLRTSSDPLGKDFFFVLPSAEHVERVISVIVQRGIPGFFHQRVTTLTRLTSEMLGLGGENIATNVTRYLILRDILSARTWDFFEEVQHTPGFLNLMLSFVAELKEALITPALFRERMSEMKGLEPELAAKYEALAGIYETYQKMLSARGLRDPGDEFPEFWERKGKASFKPPRIKRLWIDGFFDFSELQLAYLSEICEFCDEVTVTLTLDSSLARQGLFEAARRTESKLLAIGFERKELPRPKPSRVPETLAAVEEFLFSDPRPERKLKPSNEIAVFEAIGMEGEIEMIARTIQHMHRLGDYRLSDFAILLRHIGDYESVIRSVFSRYGLPVEIHERERLEFSPMIQVLVCLLKVFRDDWKIVDLMDFLKSSYVRTLGGQDEDKIRDYEWAGALEHEAQALGIFRGREAWLGQWPEKDGAEKELNQSRLTKLGHLAALEDQLRQAKSVDEIRNALLTAVEKTFGVFRISNEAEDYVLRDAASHKRLVSLFDEIERSFLQPRGDFSSEVTFELFTERFLRLVGMDLYPLHHRDKNRVQVYNISLARQKEYRVVFVAGLLEKRFPIQIKEDPVLSDWERNLFNGTRSENLLKEMLISQAIERYLFYLAVTRASYKLILTYPHLDLEGKEGLPSYYVQEVQSLFRDKLLLRRQHLGQPYPDLDEAVNTRELEMAVMGELWKPLRSGEDTAPLLLYLTNRLLEDENGRDRFRRAFFEVRDELTDERILKLDPFRSRETSASRLEEYAKCPFKYYSHYVLKLNNPDEDPNITAKGTILHQVLEECFRDWMRQPAILKDPGRAKALAAKKLEEVMAEHPLIVEKRYQYELEREDLRSTLERFLEYELERLPGSPLKPRYFEYDFGGAGGDAPAFELVEGGRRILIRGKVDRIDVDAEGKVGLVLDYKRTASFNRASLELGTALQLPIYSMVLENQLHLAPAGAELYSIKGRDKKGFYHEAYKEYFPGISSRRMILDDKAFHEVLKKGEGFIARFSRDMEALRIPVKPRECMSFCPYSAVCRIEKWKLPHILQEIKEEDRKAGNAAGQGEAAAASKGACIETD